MNEETAKRAAKWWADQLRGDAKLDNGDDSNTGAMGFMMATLLQEEEKRGQDTESIDRFESELEKLLIEQNPLRIGVDYHPDGTLQQAADNARLRLGMATLPWKTNMFFRDETIEVSCGYGASYETI